MPNENEQQVYHYSLYVIGLFGKNRKAKKEMLELFDNPGIQANPEVVRTKFVDAKLAEIKAKPGLRWQVIEQPMTVSRENGFITRKFECFTHSRILSGEVA